MYVRIVNVPTLSLFCITFDPDHLLFPAALAVVKK